LKKADFLKSIDDVKKNKKLRALSVERERPFSKAEGKESNEYAFFERDFELEQIATSSRALERARISIFFNFLCSLCRRVVLGFR
jgi:hypothetical protein